MHPDDLHKTRVIKILDMSEIADDRQHSPPRNLRPMRESNAGSAIWLYDEQTPLHKTQENRSKFLRRQINLIQVMSSRYPTRALGKTGEHVSASNPPLFHINWSSVGFGAMGMSAFYGRTPSDEENFKVLSAAADMGVTFWDTANVYGSGRNEGISMIWESK